MRILVRDRQTHRYYAAPHEWTAAHGSARSFDSIEAATRLCNQSNLADPEVLLVSDVLDGSAPLAIPPIESPYLTRTALTAQPVV